MEYPRILQLHNLLTQKSFFLFGPRSTGKSYLIRKELSQAKVYNLLLSATFQRLSRDPGLIRSEFLAQPRQADEIIVIDEIQKLPQLLDEAHALIEEYGVRFLFTGSSARKLKRKAVNLLAGRAWQANLFPLTSAEIENFDLLRYLRLGGLPSVYGAKNPFEELRAYTGTYLQEEIVAEASVRKLDSFIRFLDLAATKVGEEVNYESLASDCGIKSKTIANYFEVLEDTLIGFRLPPLRLSKIRKSISRTKFYLFDLGVTNSLLQRYEVPPRGETFGTLFEHFIILELRAYLSYRRSVKSLSFWRTDSGFEVDCIVGQDLAIEIKSTDLVHGKHLKGLKALREEGIVARQAVISFDTEMRVVDGITIYPWQLFLQKLWRDEVFPPR